MSEKMTGELEWGAVIKALKQRPEALRVLFACTACAAVTVFEPGYMTLSISLVQIGLRAQASPAPLVLAAGMLVVALITLIAGASADLFGRRRFLVLGLVGLTLSNVLGMAWLHTPQLFLIADLINTVSGVTVLPVAIALVTLAFGPALRPFAYGLLFGVQGTALVTSILLIPLLGGVWDGRAAFLPVLVLGGVALFLVHRAVPESRAPASLHRGTVILNLLFVGGLFVVMFLVVTDSIGSREVMVALLAAVFLALIARLVRVASTRSTRLQGIQIYGGRDLNMAMFAGLMLMFAQGCLFYQINPFFLHVQEVGPVGIALRYVPFVLALVAAGLLVVRVTLRFGPRLVLVFSFLLVGTAMLGLSFVRPDSSYWVMVGPFVLLGLGAGLGGPARTTVVMGSWPPGIVGGTSAINTAAGQGGYALGVIVSSVLVSRHADRQYLDALSEAGVSPESVDRVATILGDVVNRLLVADYPELPVLVQRLSGVAYSDGFAAGMARMFFIVAIAMFLTALATFFAMTRRPGSDQAPVATDG